VSSMIRNRLAKPHWQRPARIAAGVEQVEYPRAFGGGLEERLFRPVKRETAAASAVASNRLTGR
jgi:hypothetical protein